MELSVTIILMFAIAIGAMSLIAIPIKLLIMVINNYFFEKEHGEKLYTIKDYLFR